VADKLTAVKTQIKGLLKRHGLTRPDDAGKSWTRRFEAWLKCVSEQPELGAGMRATLASLLRQAKALDQELEHLDHALTELVAAPRYASAVAELIKLQGVGVLTALVFLTEVGDLGRFENRRQIGAYLGLAPSSHESGQCSDRKGHIARQGPARVRRVLCQATWARIRTESSARTAYQRIAEKNPKKKKVAVVAAMRRLAVLMWHRGREGGGSPTSEPRVRREACCAPAG
jgi:transposase